METLSKQEISCVGGAMSLHSTLTIAGSIGLAAGTIMKVIGEEYRDRGVRKAGRFFMVAGMVCNIANTIMENEHDKPRG